MALRPAPRTQLQRKDLTAVLSDSGKSVFSAFHDLLGGLETAVSLFRFAVESQLQKQLLSVQVLELIKHKTLRKELKRLGLKIRFARPAANLEHSITVLVFTNAGKPSDSAQISTLCGLLIRSLNQSSYYQIVSWTSYTYKHLVRFFFLQQEKLIRPLKTSTKGLSPKHTNSIVLGFNVNSIIVLDLRISINRYLLSSSL